MILIIISVVVFILGIMLCVNTIEDTLCVILIVLLFCLSFALMLEYYVLEPKAIDVYRNRTTLEITYKDSIPIDSVVVFKDKIK